MLNWEGKGGLQLFRTFNGVSYSVRLDGTIRRVDAYLSACTREGSGLGWGLESVLADKNFVGSTCLEAVNGIAVLDVPRLFFG